MLCLMKGNIYEFSFAHAPKVFFHYLDLTFHCVRLDVFDDFQPPAHNHFIIAEKSNEINDPSSNTCLSAFEEVRGLFPCAIFHEFVFSFLSQIG